MRFETPRDASAQDFDAIAALQIENWRSAYRGILPDAYLDDTVVEERREYWRAVSHAGPEGQLVLVTTTGDVLAGFISVYLDADAEVDATIENLHVSPQFQGCGLGRRLLAAAAERLIAIPATSVCLWVFDANVDAIRFYRRLGGKADAYGYDDFADAHAPHTRIIWGDVKDLLAACNEVAPASGHQV
jgi:ribosomal protein S18 acetylase RimI-like enzyme